MVKHEKGKEVSLTDTVTFGDSLDTATKHPTGSIWRRQKAMESWDWPESRAFPSKTYGFTHWRGSTRQF